jgi:O-antigen/teichoic acid export membrane protein
MKQSHRIILNTLATYGQSVFNVVVTLFSVRWVLQALGQTDFGLYGVVGSMIMLINLLNGGLSVGVARFYAYSIGAGKNLQAEDAVDDLNRWFNIAFVLHLFSPLLLASMGYLVGTYAIEHWLTIPADRVAACLWVFRVSLLTASLSIFSIPFVSLYRAHQYISELAFFGIIRSCLVFVGAYLLLKVESDRLIVYALYMGAISVGIQMTQIIRACYKFRACRLNLAYMFDVKKMRELFHFVGWKLFGTSCVALRMQGSPILINLFFGPQVNAGYTVANQVSVQSTTLSSAMMGAFQPAVISLEGSGERQKMLDMALQVCKFGTLLVLFFAIPLILEIHTVLELWLQTPPQYAAPLCQCMLVMLVIDRMTSGQMLAVNARGKIAAYELVQGLLLFSVLPLAWGLFKLGFGPIAMGYALVFSMTVYCFGRLLFCRKLLQMKISPWIQQVAVPVSLLIVCSMGAGLIVQQLMSAGFFRVCVTSAMTGVCSVVVGWILLLNHAEQEFVCSMIERMRVRFFRYQKSGCSA